MNQEDDVNDFVPYKNEKWNTARADPDNQIKIPILAHYGKIILKSLFGVFVLILNLSSRIVRKKNAKFVAFEVG